MKIIQLSYSLAAGGAERFIVDLCNTLSEQSNDEIILAITNDDKNTKFTHYIKDISPNVKFFSLGCKSGYTIKSFWRIFQLIRKEKPDIVHAHCSVLLIYLPSLFFHKIKFYHTLHSLAHVCIINKKLKWLYRFFYKSRIQAVTISTSCYQSFVDLYHLSNVIKINNGRIPIQQTDDKENVKKEIEAFKKKKETPVFIHVARCNPLKNQQRLFTIFEKLQQDHFDFLLLCIGRGYEKNYSPKYIDNKQIKILGEKKNVGDYLAVSDYFILSSNYEGLPLSLLEAMSMGVIPISTPAGGVKDVIIDGENGYLCDEISDDSLYKKVKQILTHKETINRNSIIKNYHDNYSMDICANKYHLLYRNQTSTHTTFDK